MMVMSWCLQREWICWAADRMGRDWLVAWDERSGYVISMPEKPADAAAVIFWGRVCEGCWPRETLAIASLLSSIVAVFERRCDGSLLYERV